MIDKIAVGRRCDEGLMLLIPQHMHGGVHRYVQYGIMPGNFIKFILTGQLDGARAIGDTINRAHLQEWQDFCFKYLPPECQGTSENMAVWCRHKGLQGLSENHESIG